MKRSTIAWSIKQICTMIEKGTITFDNPLQRPAGQWKVEDKSLLIDSTLRMFVPDIYVIKYQKEVEDRTINVYDVIDGKQRLTNFHDFKRDLYALTQLEDITLDTGETHALTGKKFSELHEDVQDAINSYTVSFKVIELEDGDDEEAIIQEIFYRLNNGKAVSREHLALVSASSNVQSYVHSMVSSDPLFTITAHYPEGSIKKSDREITVLQSILLAGDYEWVSFATRDIEKFFSENEIEQEVLKKVSSAYEVIYKAFPERNKFVTKVNIPPMVKLILNNEKNVVPFLQHYANVTKKGDPYRKYCGAGGAKRDQVKGRISGLQSLYEEYKKENRVFIGV
ncbi:DUF262 domain-containing protein [Paenibacillus xylaniclasticus]|uniref:DUF262 domain-containing protein n=1 Tax=Paenibacillus xylaniclasticus TaxID=588083 RepID=UPI00176C514E|nr:MULTISPECIES: DUF262 domain-containing protein [Paenibacillus]GFN32539.1 hypothetical protein PCURB6_27990 [Paenibacillus curdlanolyticus]